MGNCSLVSPSDLKNFHTCDGVIYNDTDWVVQYTMKNIHSQENVSQIFTSTVKPNFTKGKLSMNSQFQGTSNRVAKFRESIARVRIPPKSYECLGLQRIEMGKHFLSVNVKRTEDQNYPIKLIENMVIKVRQEMCLRIKPKNENDKTFSVFNIEYQILKSEEIHAFLSLFDKEDRNYTPIEA